MTGGWDRARTIADAVLYEGYLLYPYRANSAKNQTRWQFGVLGPAGAADAGIGEDDSLSAQVLVAPQGNPTVSIVVRFLQLQHRGVEKDIGGGAFEPADELSSGSQSWLRWDEAVEREISVRADRHRIRLAADTSDRDRRRHRHRDGRRRAAGPHPSCVTGRTDDRGRT